MFEGESGRTKLSELFAPGKETLAIYSFMFGPERERPCPGCTHFLDALEGSTQHILQRINFVVVAKSPVSRLRRSRGSAAGGSCACCRRPATTTTATISAIRPRSAPAMRDQQEFKPGEEWDMPILNVFRRDGGTVRHFWGSELLYVPPEPGQEYRHNDLLDPLWNMLDVTPEGRGDFHPKLEYPDAI